MTEDTPCELFTNEVKLFIKDDKETTPTIMVVGTGNMDSITDQIREHMYARGMECIITVADSMGAALEQCPELPIMKFDHLYKLLDKNCQEAVFIEGHKPKYTCQGKQKKRRF